MKKNKNIQSYSTKGFIDTYSEDNEFADKLKQQIPSQESCVFFINRMEEAVKAIKFPKKGVRSNYFEIFLITQGYCNLEYNLQEINQTANQIRFSSPSSLSLVKEISEDIQGYYLFFDDDFIRLSNQMGFLSNLPFFFSSTYPLIELQEETLKHFYYLFEYLIKISKQVNYNVENKISSTYLTAILLESKEMFQEILFANNTSLASQRITQDFFNLLSKSTSYQSKTKDYAEKLNLSSKYFAKSIKITTGFPPSHFIKKSIVLEAKILLKETKDSISEIAYRLGFEDVSYFTRFFKKNTEQTPLAYRASLTS